MPKGIGTATLLYRIELLSNISYDEFYKYYIEENHDQKSTMEYFDLTSIGGAFNILRDAYNCVKDRKSISATVADHNKEKYGVSNVSSLNTVKEKKKTTTVEHYGVDNIFKDTEYIKDCYHKKLGVSHPMKLKTIKEKVSDTYEERTGYRHPNQNPEVQSRMKEDMLRKYGVEYGVQLPTCVLHGGMSKPEKKFADLLDEHAINYTREFPLKGLRYDFKVDDILVEINPFATHNSTWGIYHCDPKSRTYHQGKTKLAEENGYRCIHIFDWDDIEKVVKLFYERKRVYGRKCEVKEITPYVASDFCQLHHLQNYAKSSINIGLYYEDELVSVMTFGKPRYNKNYEWELVRYCSSYNVVGGAEKLFSYFVKHYNPSSVISYCDRAKFTGDTYIKLGFKLKTWNTPSKHWYKENCDKSHITDNLLRQRGYDQLFNANYGKGTSNEQLMIDAGYVEMYDCGQSTYVWNN